MSSKENQSEVITNLDTLSTLAARIDALGDILSTKGDEGEICSETISTLGMMMMDMSEEMSDVVTAIDKWRGQL